MVAVSVKGAVNVLVEVDVVTVVSTENSVEVVNTVDEVRPVSVSVLVSVVDWVLVTVTKAGWVRVVVRVWVKLVPSDGEVMTKTMAAPTPTIIAVRRTVKTVDTARLSEHVGLILWWRAVTENMTSGTPST